VDGNRLILDRTNHAEFPMLHPPLFPLP
jgi:hypothetical protein